MSVKDISLTCVFLFINTSSDSSEYLTNVLDDLGLQTSETLTQIDALLRARPEEFSERAELMPQRLAHTIASTRGLDV